MRLALPLLLLAGCAVLPVSPRRMGTLEERVATLEKRMDVAEQAAPAFSGMPLPLDQRFTFEETHSAPVASVGMSVPYEAATKTVLGARNGSGTFTLVSGNPVVSGTTISTTWANNTLSDIATELTDSLSRSGKGPMLTALKLYGNGTAATPSLSFSNDTNTGLYPVGADDVAMAAGGTKVFEWCATGVCNSTTNGDAITATGNGTGSGIRSTGGSSSGAGGTFIGGATNGAGVVGQGTGSGIGGTFAGGSSGTGADITAGATGIGLHVTGGATSGTAFKLDVGNTVTPGFRFGTSIAPTGAALVGDMYMTTAGVLKVCVTAGTPCASFVSVGSQP